MKKIFCVLGLLVMICMISVVSLQAAVINVPTNYTTIQAAINAATSGDTINVAAGIYHEQITINKPLTINGAGGAVLDGTPTLLTPPLAVGAWTTGVKIKSGNVTFNNMDVTNFTQDGIIIGYEASTPGSLKNVHITNCSISNIQPGYWGFGIYAGYEAEAFKYSTPELTAQLDYSGLLIENNEITNTHSSALVLQSIDGSPGTLIVRNNNIHDNTTNDGIWIDSAKNIVIEDNIVKNNKWGIEITSYGDAFQGIISGAWVYDWTPHLNGPYGPKDILITGNAITDNTRDGVAVLDGYPATIHINENSITGNTLEVRNYLTEVVDATCNWWGDVSGPGAGVSVYVDADPWMVPPAPIVAPVSWDYGNVPVNSSVNKTFTITNPALACAPRSFTVSGIAVSPGDFTIVSGGTVPVTLAPGSTHEVVVRFTPTTLGPQAATLLISGDFSSLEVDIAGSGNDSGILGNWHWCNGNDYNFLDDHKLYKGGVPTGTWALTNVHTSQYTVTWNAGWIDVLILSSDGLKLDGTNQYGDHVTATRNASNCLATMDVDSSGKLSLKIPYLSDVIPMLGTQYLEVEFAYVFNPTLLLFELTKYHITQSPSFCAASTLSSDLKIHIPDLLLPDGTTHYWVNLEYSSALSTDGNAYFVITNFGDVSD